MDPATTSWPAARRPGGIAASLGCSALLHGALVLLPLGLAGTENSAFAASPAVAAKSHLPLVVDSLNHTRRVEAPAQPAAATPPDAASIPAAATPSAPMPATPPPSPPQRPRVVELSADVVPSAPAGPAGAAMFDQYFKAAALTTLPGLYTLGPTEPASYDAMAGGGRLVIELFLGESGAVEHWQVVEETAPPAFRQHVLNTFLAATYTPGRLFERAVKSRLKVEASLAPGGKYPP